MSSEDARFLAGAHILDQVELIDLLRRQIFLQPMTQRLELFVPLLVGAGAGAALGASAGAACGAGAGGRPGRVIPRGGSVRPGALAEEARVLGAEARAPQAASASVPTYTAWERVWDSRSLRHSNICTDTTDRSLIARVCWHAPAGWALHQFMEAVRPAHAVLLPGLPACGVLALEPVLPLRLRVTPEALCWETANPDNPFTAQPEALTLTIAIPLHCGWGT